MAGEKWVQTEWQWETAVPPGRERVQKRDARLDWLAKRYGAFVSLDARGEPVLDEAGLRAALREALPSVEELAINTVVLEVREKARRIAHALRRPPLRWGE